MKPHTTMVLAWTVAAFLAGTGPARANSIQAVENAWETCAAVAARAERRAGIPQLLLHAISLAESGRWDDTDRANVAWPWTVTAEGRGRFFDTKAEALAEVEILMTQGVSNIDVGCMQVNLYYHGGAFESLDEAMDPEANATYAAEYLRNMFRATGDWRQATGYYHSTTPERTLPYRDKVMAYWRELGGLGALVDGDGAEQKQDFAAPTDPIDHARMVALNARFKARREAERADERQPDSFAETRRKQLDAWRNASQRGQGTLHLLAMRQAELSLKRKREMERLTRDDKEIRFTERRKRQLEDWRRRVAGTRRATGMAAAAAGAAVR